MAKDETLEHKSISIISITRINTNEIEINAISSGNSIRKEVFTEGTDFELENGTITLNKYIDGANDIVVGASYEKSVLGIDLQGHGKYRNSGGAAGVALLVMPIVAIGRTDVRFERVK